MLNKVGERENSHIFFIILDYSLQHTLLYLFKYIHYYWFNLFIIIYVSVFSLESHS